MPLQYPIYWLPVFIITFRREWQEKETNVKLIKDNSVLHRLGSDEKFVEQGIIIEKWWYDLKKLVKNDYL